MINNLFFQLMNLKIKYTFLQITAKYIEIYNIYSTRNFSLKNQ